MKKIMIILLLVVTLIISGCKSEETKNTGNLDLDTVDCTEQVAELTIRNNEYGQKVKSSGEYLPGIYYGEVYVEVDEEEKNQDGLNFAEQYTATIVVDNSGKIVSEIYDYVVSKTEVVDGVRQIVQNRSYLVEQDQDNIEEKLAFKDESFKEKAKNKALLEGKLPEDRVLYEGYKYGDYKPGTYSVELNSKYRDYNITAHEKLYFVIDDLGNLINIFTLKTFNKVLEEVELEESTSVAVANVSMIELDQEEFMTLVENNGQFGDDLGLVSIYYYFWAGVVPSTELMTTSELLSKKTCSNSSNQKKLDGLIQEYGEKLSIKEETKYVPGIYHGVAYATEIDENSNYTTYNQMYTASVVVSQTGDIAGVHYDRITISHVEDEESSKRYYLLKKANINITNSEFQISNSYFEWIDNDQDGTISNNDIFIIQNGPMARTSLKYNKDGNTLTAYIGMESFVYRDIVFDLEEQIYSTKQKVESDYYNNIPVVNEVKMAEARFNALNGIGLSVTPGPFYSTEWTMRKKSSGAIAPAGYVFKDTQDTGRYKPGTYYSKIDETHPDYVVGNQTYLVAVVDESGNIAGTYVNNLASSGFLRNEIPPFITQTLPEIEANIPDADNYDVIQNIKISEMNEAIISERTIEGYYDGVYIGEAYDVFYEINEENIYKTSKCVKFDKDLICESGSTALKFVYVNGEYETYKQIRVFNEETQEYNYFWQREVTYEYNSHNLTTFAEKTDFYVPKIEFNALDSQILNEKVMSGDTDFSDNEALKALFDIMESVVLIER